VLHLERVGSDALSLDDLFEGAVEGVVADGAEGEGSAGILEGVRGPLDELGKMEEEVGFDFVFALALGIRARWGAGESGEEEREGENSEDSKT